MSHVRAEGPSPTTETSTACWQPGFLKLLPMIEGQARYHFRRIFEDEALEEAVQEVVCNACVAFARLAKQGRTEVASATSLARFGINQYWRGCRVGAALNSKDVCSVYCRRKRNVRVQPLCRWDDAEDRWRELLVEDRTAGPADLAASRIDFASFMAGLGTRTRKIAEQLAVGETTNRVAKMFGLTAARISQIRRELHARWEAMHTASVEATAA